MALPKLFQRIFWHNNTNPDINEDNLNAMSKGLSDVDDRLISLAGTIMEDVPQIIADMEILGPAVENIDENVARAEAAAESAEQYAEEIAPPIEVVKDFVPIITLGDAINKPVKDLKVKVDAVQDLHGYTKPWVGGAGKNVLQLTLAGLKANNTGGTWSGNVYTINGVAHTVQFDADGNITGFDVHGTASGYTFLNINIPKYDKNVQYKLVVTGATSAFTSQVSYQATQGADSVYLASITGANTATFTMPNADVYSMRSRFYMISGGSANHVKIQIMVCKATESSDFASYTNICPITGWTEANVYRGDENFFNPTLASTTSNGITYTKGDDNTYALTGKATASHSTILGTIKLPVGTYKIFGSPSGTTGEKPKLRLYDGTAEHDILYDGYTFTVTDPDKTYTVYIRVPGEMVNVQITDALIFKPMITLDTSATYNDFEPYNGEIFTIDLGDTRYGCVLDVDAGTLTINRVFKSITSVEQISTNTTGYSRWQTTYNSDIKTPSSNAQIGSIKSNMFETVSADNTYYRTEGIAIHTNTRIIFYSSAWAGMSATDINTMLSTNPVQVVYELATPQTITLTPTEVELLFGYNTLFADTGDISLTYDASGVLRVATTLENEVNDLSEKLTDYVILVAASASYTVNANATVTVAGQSLTVPSGYKHIGTILNSTGNGSVSAFTVLGSNGGWGVQLSNRYNGQITGTVSVYGICIKI